MYTNQTWIIDLDYKVSVTKYESNNKKSVGLANCSSKVYCVYYELDTLLRLSPDVNHL